MPAAAWATAADLVILARACLLAEYAQLVAEPWKETQLHQFCAGAERDDRSRRARATHDDAAAGFRDVGGAAGKRVLREHDLELLLRGCQWA
jgi:hypothetical protein